MQSKQERSDKSHLPDQVPKTASKGKEMAKPSLPRQAKNKASKEKAKKDMQEATNFRNIIKSCHLQAWSDLVKTKEAGIELCKHLCGVLGVELKQSEAKTADGKRIGMGLFIKDPKFFKSHLKTHSWPVMFDFIMGNCAQKTKSVLKDPPDGKTGAWLVSIMHADDLGSLIGSRVPQGTTLDGIMHPFDPFSFMNSCTGLTIGGSPVRVNVVAKGAKEFWPNADQMRAALNTRPNKKNRFQFPSGHFCAFEFVGSEEDIKAGTELFIDYNWEGVPVQGGSETVTFDSAMDKAWQV